MLTYENFINDPSLFNNYKSRELIKFKCSNCEKISEITKHSLQNKIYRQNAKKNFCSSKCKGEYIKKLRPLYKCGNCNIQICKSSSEFKKNKSGIYFCSHSCSAIYQNRNYKWGKRGPEKTKYPSCKVSFKQCSETGKWYCAYGRHGISRTQISPYTRTKKELFYIKCKFLFNVYNYPQEFDLDLIETFGWYSCPGKKRKNKQKNVNGISRDHIISISDAYKNNYDPYYISHPANCQLIPHIKNVSKGINSNISYDELKEKVLLWNKKYNEL